MINYLNEFRSAEIRSDNISFPITRQGYKGDEMMLRNVVLSLPVNGNSAGRDQEIGLVGAQQSFDGTTSNTSMSSQYGGSLLAAASTGTRESVTTGGSINTSVVMALIQEASLSG
jgi:hypothetical protein